MPRRPRAISYLFRVTDSARPFTAPVTVECASGQRNAEMIARGQFIEDHGGEWRDVKAVLVSSDSGPCYRLSSEQERDGAYRVLARRGYAAECSTADARTLITNAGADAVAAACAQYAHESQPQTNYNRVSNPDGV
jgi:hypothetical protein